MDGTFPHMKCSRCSNFKWFEFLFVFVYFYILVRRSTDETQPKNSPHLVKFSRVSLCLDVVSQFLPKKKMSLKNTGVKINGIYLLAVPFSIIAPRYQPFFSRTLFLFSLVDFIKQYELNNYPARFIKSTHKAPFIFYWRINNSVSASTTTQMRLMQVWKNTTEYKPKQD